MQIILNAIYSLAPVTVLCGALLALALQRATRRQLAQEKIIFCISLTAHLCLLLIYLSTPYFFGLSDFSAANVARAYLDGNPMYGTPLTNNTGHAILYGPLYFLPTLLAFKLAGVSVSAAKFSGALQYLIWLMGIVIFQFKSPASSKQESSYRLTGMLLSLGFFMPFEFCLIQIVALYALWFPIRSRIARSLAGGVAAAIAGNLRIHGFLYVLSGALDLEKRSLRDALRNLIFFFVFFVGVSSPFLFQGVSLNEYLGMLTGGVRHGFPADVIATQMCWLLIVGGAALCAAEDSKGAKHETDPVTVTLSGLSLSALFLASCKAGSGPHHLIAALPLLLLFLSKCRFRLPQGDILQPAAVCLSVSLAVVGTARGAKNGYDLIRFPADALFEDIRGIANQARGNVALGFGGDQDLNWTRPGGLGRILATGFLFPKDLQIGNHTTLMDFKKSGHDLDAFVLPKIMSSRIEYLAFPKRSKPLQISSWYDETPLLTQATVDSFHQRYEFAYQSRFFDIYQLRHP